MDLVLRKGGTQESHLYELIERAMKIGDRAVDAMATGGYLMRMTAQEWARSAQRQDFVGKLKMHAENMMRRKAWLEAYERLLMMAEVAKAFRDGIELQIKGDRAKGKNVEELQRYKEQMNAKLAAAKRELTSKVDLFGLLRNAYVDDNDEREVIWEKLRMDFDNNVHRAAQEESHAYFCYEEWQK